MKHLLFVYVGLPLGGIETLLVRLAEGLSRRGLKISVLLAKRTGSAELTKRLAAAARVAYLDEFVSPVVRRLPELPLLRMCMPLDGHRLRAWLGGVPDACHAADTGSVLLATRIAHSADVGPLTIGIYHDREYLFEDVLTGPVNRDMTKLFSGAPVENLLFFNESSVRTHAQRFRLDLEQAKVCPVGVDLSRFGTQILGQQSNRIVSIGRLTPFKTYNRVMLDVIARLKAQGTPLHYDIWGDGECRPLLEQRVVELGVADLVTLKGPLDYGAMEQALSGAMAFLGSGTALIEASAAGLPAIAAIENEPGERSYGCLHDFPGLSYHDAGLDHPLTTFGDRIMALRELSAQAYRQECLAAQKRAQDFSLELTLDRFEQLAGQAGSYSPSTPPTRALSWLAATACTKLGERLGRRSTFIHRHSAAP